MRCVWWTGIASVTRMLCATAIVGTMVAVASAQQPPPDDGQEIFAKVCGSCHSTQQVTSSRRTRQQWLQTVGQMVARGATGSSDDFLTVVNYLSAHYGRINVNSATAAEIVSSTDLSIEQANAIVAYRRDHGAIDGFNELEKVPGLDANKLKLSRDALTFGIEISGVGRVPVSALTEANNWPTVAGSPQRDGWATNEELLSRNTVRKLKLLYKYKLNNQATSLQALTSPVVLGSLLGHQGIKQLLILGGSSDRVYSIDADLNREIWSSQLDRQSKSLSVAGGACPVALTALVIPGATAFRGFSEPSGGGTRKAGPAAPGAVASPFVGFGVGPIFAVSSNGYLHTMYQSNGAEENVPVRIVPMNSHISSLNINKTMIYATTVGDCGAPNGIYALDVAGADGRVISFATNGSGPSGTAGTAIGSDDTIYAQIAEGEGGVAGEYSDTVLALTPNDLRVRDYFTPSTPLPALVKDAEPQGVTPAVFRWKDKEIVVASGRDGRLYLLDSEWLGGPDHHIPLYRSEPIAGICGGCGIRGAFATWEDADTKIRWIYASIWGPDNSAAKARATSGVLSSSGIAAFKVEDRDGKPALVLAWKSREIFTPAAPVVANGLIFALSTGQPSRLIGDDGAPYIAQQLEEMAKPATLHVLDSATGKELFSSGNVATSFSYGSGLAVANGRIYFTTHDNTVYAYGFPMEH
jgi:competence ComEA-like helix-hairpin-helix protein